MLLSNLKYQDPTKVLQSIVDDNGEPISIYEQADIGEFFLNFLERMQDGLGESKALMRKLMGDDLVNNLRESNVRGLSGSNI
jgi:ubiquitin carboxyl-terminal hydrolase 25/28